MYCTKCGNKLGDDDKVCGQCGAPVKMKPAKPKAAAQMTDHEKGGTEQTGFANSETETEPSILANSGEGTEPSILANSGEGTEPPAYAESVEKEILQEEVPPTKQGNKGPLIGLLVFLLVLALAGVAGVAYVNRDVLFHSDSPESEDSDDEVQTDGERGNGEQTDGDEKAGADGGKETAGENVAEVNGQNPDAAGNVILAQNELSAKIAELNQAGKSAMSIDVFEEHYTPGTRNVNYSWDRSLFYSLEDVDPNSAADGKINGYDITRKLLKNAQSGNKMEYEIYKNPSTGKVNKIVSIEYFPDHLEITDYYYNDTGKVSFIFVRDDINYIPSYAVPSKDGQRYYFNSDCMVKWRVVTGGVQTNYVIGNEAAKNNPAGGVVLYSNLDSSRKASYDEAEKRMLNAAYNTYNTVLGAEGISEITGYVYDDSGNAKAGAQVVLYEDSDGLYQTKTDASGYYGIVIPSEKRDYRLKVSDDGCVPAELYNISISDSVLSDYQDTVYMLNESDTPYNVSIRLFDALNYSADGINLQRLSGAAVYIRNGMNHREGNVIAQGTADASGELQISLKPGMYTAEVMKQGYDTVYYNFAVRENMQLIQINASPTLASGEVRIVLTWGEKPEDLDSHLFTPYDTSIGDSTYHIWYGNTRDTLGDNLDVDDTTSYGPETVTIPVLKNGLYKYYVADFTNCSQGYPSSNAMSLSGAAVNVYTSAGLTATFHVPSNVPGVIWEVFEIRNGAIIPIQRYYTNIEDKSWWHSDK